MKYRAWTPQDLAPLEGQSSPPPITEAKLFDTVPQWHQLASWLSIILR
jgi:hypothetical protein